MLFLILGWYGGRVEYQPALDALPGLSFFADVADGEKSYDHAVAGIRFYFGTNKSLIKRHREDDPANSLFDAVTSSYTAIKAAQAAELDSAAAAASSGAGGGVGGGI